MADLKNLAIDRQNEGRSTVRYKRKFMVPLVVLFVILIAVILRYFYPSSVQVETTTVSLVYPSQGFTLLNASGYVVAQRRAAVAPKTTAQLEWLGVAEGSIVRAGELIARLENRDVTAGKSQAEANVVTSRAILDQARAELVDAERSFGRAKELLASGIIAQADFDAAEVRVKRARALVAAQESSVKSALAALDGADAAVEYTMIRAPFDAVVLTKNADIGDIVTPIGAAATAKAAVVTIADLSSLQVEADVSESNLEKIKVGQPCEIQLDAFPDSRFRGVLQTIVPTADRTKASVMVKVRFVDKDRRVLPEMSAKVAFLERMVASGEEKPSLAVPVDALAGSEGAKIVYRVKDGTVSRVPVTTGGRIGDMVEVRSGVQAGDQIVSRPSPKLADGSRVKLPEKR